MVRFFDLPWLIQHDFNLARRFFSARTDIMFILKISKESGNK